MPPVSATNRSAQMAKISAAKNDAKTRAAILLAPRLREGALIGLLLLCVYILVALLTYDERDPGWSHTAFSGRFIIRWGEPAPGCLTCCIRW